MKQRSIATGVLVLLVLGTLLVHAADWPHWRGPDRSGTSKETGWLKAFTDGKASKLWSAEVGIGFSSVAVADGRVYTMGYASNRSTLYCFETPGGKKLWSYDYPTRRGAKMYEGGPHATPAVAAGRVYTLSKWGTVYCFDAAKGTLVWKTSVAKDLKLKTPKWAFATSPLVLGKRVFLNMGTHGVALDADKGTVAWSSGTDAAGYATPVPFTSGGTQCLAIFGKNKLYGVTDAGKVLWEFPWQTRYDVNAADPIISGDTIFISSGYNRGCALVRFTDSSATKVWENRSMRNHFNSCVLLDGNLYGFNDTTLTCLRIRDGKVLWTQGGLGKGSLILAAGKLIILSEDGRLVVADAVPGAFTQRLEKRILKGRCWTSPVLADGRIYARNAAGDLVCYGPK